jgi:GH35 family endo-1,4-beta-xylanase
VGGINKKKDNLRLQFKITHKEDMNAIDYYNNYNKVLNEDNQYPEFVTKMQKNISCMVPFLSDYTQPGIRESAANKNMNQNNYIEQIFSSLFYGNKDFYNLPDVS